MAVVETPVHPAVLPALAVAEIEFDIHGPENTLQPAASCLILGPIQAAHANKTSQPNNFCTMRSYFSTTMPKSIFSRRIFNPRPGQEESGR